MNGILSDREIAALNPGFITPFVDGQAGRAQGQISYGLSSYGYDARLARQFRVFRPREGAIFDPKNFDDSLLTEEEGDHCIIPPHGYMLGVTVERFSLPEDVLAICVGKSTLARAGISLNVTALEPGWEGYVTLEIKNETPCAVKVYAGEGICQFLFFRGLPCEISYAKRAGKYQGQAGVTLARV